MYVTQLCIAPSQKERGSLPAAHELSPSSVNKSWDSKGNRSSVSGLFFLIVQMPSKTLTCMPHFHSGGHPWEFHLAHQKMGRWPSYSLISDYEQELFCTPVSLILFCFCIPPEFLNAHTHASCPPPHQICPCFSGFALEYLGPFVPPISWGDPRSLHTSMRDLLSQTYFLQKQRRLRQELVAETKARDGCRKWKYRDYFEATRSGRKQKQTLGLFSLYDQQYKHCST